MEYHDGLVSCETLFAELEDERFVVFDCRHDLTDAKRGPAAYAEGHIPGAFHAHIDHDLSADPGDGSGGRHPLPDPETFVAFLRRHGVGRDTQVVAYDDADGSWAARLWWLLRHYGHKHVAVLDGGLRRWKALDLPLQGGDEERREGDFDGEPAHMPTIDATRITFELGEEGGGTYQLVDARDPERYRGEREPIDPVAGHIPGAINIPFQGNVADDGRFLSPDELRTRYEDALGVQEVGRVAAYCGSGVTAAHDILAMHVAGMGTAALYPGSWSEWCQPEAGRDVETPAAKTA